MNDYYQTLKRMEQNKRITSAPNTFSLKCQIGILACYKTALPFRHSLALKPQIKSYSLNKEPLPSSKVLQENRLKMVLSNIKQDLCYLSFLEISFSKMPCKAFMPRLKKALRQGSALALNNLFLQNSSNSASLELDLVVNLLINWLFHPKLGYLAANALTKVLHKNTVGQHFFVRCFLKYQKQHLLSFYYEKSITDFEIETVLIFYKKVNLLKLICFILKTYNPSFLQNLTLKQQYFFSKNVILLTRQSGCYKYINSLFEPLKWDPQKQVVNVSDIDVFLPA